MGTRQTTARCRYPPQSLGCHMQNGSWRWNLNHHLWRSPSALAAHQTQRAGQGRGCTKRRLSWGLCGRWGRPNGTTAPPHNGPDGGSPGGDLFLFTVPLEAFLKNSDLVPTVLFPISNYVIILVITQNGRRKKLEWSLNEHRLNMQEATSLNYTSSVQPELLGWHSISEEWLHFWPLV